jgi:hypothetical protein
MTQGAGRRAQGTGPKPPGPMPAAPVLYPHHKSFRDWGGFQEGVRRIINY